MTHLRLDAMPAMGRASLSAMSARKSRRPAEALAPLSAEVAEVRFGPARLSAFHRVCRAPTSGNLPLTAPHVLVAPLHMTMLAHEAFTMPLLGLVHVDNRIVQHRPLPADGVFQVRCALGALSSDEKGQRFTLETEVRLGGELVWEESSGILRRAARRPGKRPPRPPTPPGEDANCRRSVLWRVPKDAGRRYAQVSGDYNPIHLTAATARLFGFKRAIVHGMWSVARCVAELDDELRPMVAQPVALDVAFKTPVFLPATVAFAAYDDGAGVRFGLRSSDGSKPHVTGQLSPA